MGEKSMLSVSVIIPAFNREKFISEAVESIRSQDYDNIEIIAVDDGSSDRTYEILKGFQENGSLELYYHPRRANKGQSASINLGISNASGDAIVILDSDDLLERGAVRRHVEFLESHPDIGLVYGYGKAIDEKGEPLGFNTLGADHVERGDPNGLLLDCYIALPGGTMVRKDVYKRVGGFAEEFRAGQDHDMALRLFEETKVAYVPEAAFCYRKHEDSISNKGLERRWKTGFEILDRARGRYPYRAATIRKRAAVLNFRLGQTYWRQGRRLEALPLLLKSGLLDPVRAVKVLVGHELSN